MRNDKARVSVITEDLNELLHAAEDVVRTWSHGDLAKAVNRLQHAYENLTGRKVPNG